MPKDLIDGVSVRIGTQDYVVPPLTLKQIKKYRPMLATMGDLQRREPTDEELDGLVEVAHAALGRNYPNLGLDELGDMIDMGNLPKIMSAIVGVSGLEAKGAGEAPA